MILQRHKERIMAVHTATIEWVRNGHKFTDNQYSRVHSWRFDGGLSVPASSSPHVVRIPLSNPANVDPEEAFVAALSSCHMLWFLGLAAAKGYVIDNYTDDAQGTMDKSASGKEWVSRVLLRPHVVFSGAKAPNDAVVEGLHHEAHAECYLANSVKTSVETAGSWQFTATDSAVAR
jgi:organic hydroperoxide reductase OsmC/OhrA